MANPGSHRRALAARIQTVCIALAVGACQSGVATDDRSAASGASAPITPEKPAPPQTASTQAPPRAQTTPPAVTPPGVGELPPALPQRSIGVWQPADWLAGAERVAVLRVGDTPYIAAAGTGFLRVFTADGRQVATAEDRGAAQVLTALGSDADRATLAIGRGISRHDRTAPMSASLYHFDGRSLTREPIALTPGSRAQVVFIGNPGQAATGRAIETLWVAAFESKYMAGLLRARRGENGFRTEVVDRIRVPLDMALGALDESGERPLYVARPYGDVKDLPGDVYRFRGAGARDPLPTTRGARAVIAHGREVIAADGWHKDYGRRANALLTRFVPDGDGWRSQILAHVAGRHGYNRLQLGHVDGDEHIDLIAAGNGPAVLIAGLEPVQRDVPTLGTVEARDIAVGDLARSGARSQATSGARARATPDTRSRRQQVVIAGPTPGIWRLDD